MKYLKNFIFFLSVFGAGYLFSMEDPIQSLQTDLNDLQRELTGLQKYFNQYFKTVDDSDDEEGLSESEILKGLNGFQAGFKNNNFLVYIKSFINFIDGFDSASETVIEKVYFITEGLLNSIGVQIYEKNQKPLQTNDLESLKSGLQGLRSAIGHYGDGMQLTGFFENLGAVYVTYKESFKMLPRPNEKLNGLYITMCRDISLAYMNYVLLSGVNQVLKNDIDAYENALGLFALVAKHAKQLKSKSPFNEDVSYYNDELTKLKNAVEGSTSAPSTSAPPPPPSPSPTGKQQGQGASKSTGDRGDLLAAIQKGKALKKVDKGQIHDTSGPNRGASSSGSSTPIIDDKSSTPPSSSQPGDSIADQALQQKGKLGKGKARGPNIKLISNDLEKLKNSCGFKTGNKLGFCPPPTKSNVQKLVNELNNDTSKLSSDLQEFVAAVLNK